MMKTEDYKRELVFIFFAQKKVIVWTTALIFVLSVLIAFLWPPTYGAYGSILVRGKKIEKSPELLEKEELRPFPVTKEDLSSEVEILTSPDTIEKTIKYLYDNNLYYKKKKWTKISLNEEVYNIKNSLKTELIPASNVIEITYYHKNPNDASTILRVLMDQYMIYRMNIYNPDKAELFFAQQADNFHKGLETMENELMDLVKKNKVSDPLKEIENNILIKKDLEQQLNILKNDSTEKILYIEHLEKELNKKDIQFFSFIENNPINSANGLSPKLQTLVVERGNILRTYSPSSEKVKSIDKQINETYASLKSEVIAYKENQLNQLHIVNEKIRNIENTLDSINARNVELQKQLILSQRIARESNLLGFSYDTFSKRREEAKINTSVNATNFSSHISILSKAFPSDGPVFPKRKVVIPLGLLVGFITGCSLGFLREYFDHTFKNPSDVYNYAGLSLIFSIPATEETEKKGSENLGGTGLRTFIVGKTRENLFVIPYLVSFLNLIKTRIANPRGKIYNGAEANNFKHIVKKKKFFTKNLKRNLL